MCKTWKASIQSNLPIIAAVSLTVLILGSAGDAFAAEQSETSPPTIMTGGDLYVKSNSPVHVPFGVTATDSYDNPVMVECDKMAETVFKVGKTTVRCIATDSFGNEARDSFVITVGYDIVQIPSWLKHITQFWTSGSISDDEYFQTLSFLLEEQIVHVPHTKMSKDKWISEIPVWIKDNAEKWVNDEISNDEFSIGIQWMLHRGMV